MTRLWALPFSLLPLLVASAADADGPPRTVPTEANITFELATPKITDFKLANGVHVYHVERAGLPVVAVHVASSRGSTTVGPGIATLAAGAAVSSAYDAFWIRHRKPFNQRGAELRATSHRDVTSVFGRTLSPNFPELAEDLMEILNADFGDGDTTNAARQRRVLAVAHDRWEPATRHAREALYPKAHPHSHGADGSAADLAAVSTGDMRAFWKSAFSASALSVSIVGAISLDEARRVCERTFGTLPIRAVPALAPTSVPTLERRLEIVLVDRPGATQASVVVAGRAVERRHPKRTSLHLALVQVEGALQSRLVYGYGSSYEVTATLDDGTQAPPFWLTADIETVEAPAAVREMLRAIRRVRSGEFSEAGAARKALLVAIEKAREFETTGRAAELIATTVAQGLPISTLAQEPSRVARTPKAMVVSAAQDYLDPTKLRVVVVGDAALLRPRLEALGLGKVTVRQ